MPIEQLLEEIGYILGRYQGYLSGPLHIFCNVEVPVYYYIYRPELLVEGQLKLATISKRTFGVMVYLPERGEEILVALN